MKKFKSILSFALIFFIMFGLAPKITPAKADQSETYSLANGNIEVVVSDKNGGFVIRTREGDVFNKDDDNKKLLFHNGEYDTSFTSFQVTEGTKVSEYIFGGDYFSPAYGRSTLSVTQDDNSIISTWSADGLIFTQLIQPVWNDSANEHGTIAIFYTVQNTKGTDVDVKARLLLDTAMGDQDYGYYELSKADGGYMEIVRETVVQGDDIPGNFFAYDNLSNPSITAFTINDTATESVRPYKAAFGHWNNLAATIFEFDPDSDLTFTNKYNKKYSTADSAYALYYDLGHIPANSTEAANFLTYYGIYSNIGAGKGDKFSVNITAPSSLELNSTKDAYIGSTGIADGIFTVTTIVSNIIQEGAVPYDRIAVAVYVDEGFEPMDANGQPTGANFNDPYKLGIDNFKVGEIKQMDWHFKSEVFAAPGYRKITFKVYNMPDNANNKLLLENVIGSASTYVLCPGGNGKLPEILFTGASPEMLYFEGTRHFYLSGSGFNMLRDTSRYTLKAYPQEETAVTKGLSYTIPSENIIFTTDKDNNTIIDVVMTEKMELGTYNLIFEWAYGQNPAGIPEKLTAPALKFVVTDDKSYKNDYYGIAAIVKEEPQTGKWEYHIKTFPGEVQFKAFKENESNKGKVLIELRGEFTVQRDAEGNVISCSAASLSESSDPININGVLDLTEGDLMVALSDTPGQKCVIIDMEGNLLTSYSRTPVWNGVAYLTPLEYGKEYALVGYDRRGNKLEKDPRKDLNEISILWDADYKILQTIAGMVVDMKYGTLGRMYDIESYNEGEDENTAAELGYVLSFGASLDISQLMPDGKDDDEDSGPMDLGLAYAREHSNERSAQRYLKEYNKSKQQAKDENEANKAEPVGKVNIEDILYGLNQGYLGINAEAELTLPKYTEAFSELGGKLSINTINGYKFGVEGKCETEAFEVEFELVVIGASDGTPVPDKIFFRIAGFEPGINLDGAGVFWLTGGGGGIDKLYDSIFGSGLPPATVLLTVDFEVMKVMEARCDLSLSLRGFRIKLSDVKIKGTKLVIIKQGELGVEWYPDFYLLIAASMDILKILEGACYLVVDKDFVEFFLRVGVKIPKEVPIIGGMVLARVDLGASSERIWGVLTIIGLKLGIVYYWGGDFKFSTQDDTVEPSFPELLGLEDIPVGYNIETGETLYMKVGTNLSPAARAQVVDDINSTGLILLGTNYPPSVRSDAQRTTHKLNLGSTDNDNDFVFSIDFPENGPTTIDDAKAAVSVKKPDGTPYTLNFFDITKNGGAGNADESGVNANLIVYDEATGKSSVSISITEYAAGDWEITTNEAADIVLFTVAPLPEVNSFTASLNSGKLDLSWTGSKLDETKMSFYVTNNIGDGRDIGEMGTLIGSLEPSAATGGSITLPIPADLKTGTYYVRMTMSKEEEVNDLYLAEDAGGSAFNFDWTNANQPDQPDNVAIENAGNLMLKVNIADDQDSARYDGYLVNVYEKDGDDLFLTDITGLSFEKGADILVGGTYTDMNGTTYGLTAGKNYVVGVTAYKNINPGSDNEVMVTGAEKQSAPLTLRQPDPPEITFRADAAHKNLDRMVTKSDTQTDLVIIETFTTNEVKFTLLPDQTVAGGRWYIDDMNPVNVTGISTDGLSIRQYLPDGDHTVTFIGTNSHGDGFRYSKIFSVDTTPPRLMLTSPTNGSFFSDDGNLGISGVTDTDAMFTVNVDGQSRIVKRTLQDMGVAIGTDGTFSFDLALDPGEASHRIEITVEDKAGNKASSFVKVWNSGLSAITDLDILLDGIEYSGSNIVLNEDEETTGLLSLQATTSNGMKYIVDDDSMVTWEVIVREGSAKLDGSGQFTASPESAGIAAAYFHVADGADMSAAVSFGAERFNPPAPGSYMLTMANTIGGTVTGGGNFAPGTEVSISATPLPGYRFSGWTSLNGGSFADASGASTTFTMPSNDTTVTAHFTHIASKSGGSGGNKYIIHAVPSNAPINAEKGQLVSVALTDDQLREGNYLVPCYYLDGKKYIAANSTIIEGNLIYIAPATAEYTLEVNKPEFLDISDHWAGEYIGFTAARDLFRGVGNSSFDPDGQMTRAMFVTVLARLDGADLSSYRNTRFKDVISESWYESAVEWALQNKIINGTSETTFAPDEPITREQMAVIIYNYFKGKGYYIGTTDTEPAPFSDIGSVSMWAEEAVKWIQSSGIMNGKPDNIFDPSAIASRAECCTVFTRLIMAILDESVAP